MTETRYDIFFNVTFTHRYFTGGRLSCLRTSPDPQCRHFLERNKMIFKPQANGFTVLYEAVSNGTKNERAGLMDNTSLRFILTLEDQLFYNFTSDLMKNAATMLLHFHNNQAANEGESPANLLHSEEFVSEKDVLPLQDVGQTFFTKPFGIIDIKLVQDLPANYTIQFKEKTSYWRYHLVSEHLKSLESPGVVGPGTELFSEPVITTLPDKREALTFVSGSPLALSETYKHNYQLVENYEPGATKYKVVIKALPCPDVASMSLIKNGTELENINYSEIFIY